ncbi:MAG: 50S ribosomal protein L13 [Phycisphaerales bacterium]
MPHSVVSARRQTTLTTKPDGVERKYYVVDATGIPLGRLAVQVANVLMGKHRPDYTPHVDTGENVIVINAKQVEMTGNKGEANLKMRYTEYPGGLKVRTYAQVREQKPDQLISDAVRRMMPKNRLSRVMLKKLYVYPGKEHGFAANKPTPMTVL